MSNPSKRHEEKAREILDAKFAGVYDVADLELIATALASAEAELLREMMEPSAGAVLEAFLHRGEEATPLDVWRAMLVAEAKERGIELEKPE